jgi:hypothetical protein
MVIRTHEALRSVLEKAEGQPANDRWRNGLQKYQRAHVLTQSKMLGSIYLKD